MESNYRFPQSLENAIAFPTLPSHDYDYALPQKREK